MNCDRVEELLAAYALSALSPEESADVHAHLEGCRRHDEALAELAAVQRARPLAAEERQPPAALRERLLTAYQAERTSGMRTPVAEARATARPRPLWSGRERFFAAAAAALALAVIGLAAWNVMLQSDRGDATLVRDGQTEAGRARLVYLKDRDIGVLETEMPREPSGRVYQAWAMYGERAVSLGIVPGQGVAAFEAEIDDADAVGFTLEPPGGSVAPTTPPFFVLSLDR